MPRRKTYKKKKRSKRRAYYPLVSMGTPSGVQTNRRAKLRYSDLITLTSTSGGRGSYTFRANSVFDPDYTATGHQPISYDFWANMYNHYVVLGSKITMTVADSGTSTTPGIIGIFLDDDTTIPYSTPNTFIESGKGTWKMLQGDKSKPSTVISKYSAKKFFNVTDVNDNLNRLGANVVSNPTESAEFHCWYFTLDASTETVYAQVVVDYIVEFSEPKALASS